MFLNLFKERIGIGKKKSKRKVKSYNTLFRFRSKPKPKPKSKSKSKSTLNEPVNITTNDDEQHGILNRMNAKKQLIEDSPKHEILKPGYKHDTKLDDNIHQDSIFHFLSTLNSTSGLNSRTINRNDQDKDKDKDKEIQDLKNEVKVLKESLNINREEKWSVFIDNYIDTWFDKNKSDVNIGVIDVYGMFKIDVLPDDMEKYIYKKILKIIISMVAEINLN